MRIQLNRPHPAYFLPIDDENPVTLKALSGGSKIKIWQSQTKGGSPLTLPHQYESDTGWPKVLWVEGVQTSSDPCDVTLALEYTTQGWTIRDKINITVFDAAMYKCASDFMPKGGDQDNIVGITAAVEPTGLTGVMKFTLYDVSDEAGYCLNRPAQIPDPGQEDSESWKDLQFEDMQTGLTVCGPYNEQATTDEAVNTQDVNVVSYDYGAYGKIKMEVEIGSAWYTAHVVCGTAKFARIPLDDDENNIADAWAYNTGNAEDDVDTSLNNSHNGDGLTRYEEYRGVDINGDNIISDSERLNPSQKDLFIQGSGFGGDFPGFSWGNAFNEAQIVVHEFEGEVGTEDRNIDVLVVEAYNGTAPGNSGNIGRSGPPVGGVRQWWWSTMGQSDVGTSTQYGSEISYTRVYKVPINNRFDQKPHKDGTTLTAPGVWGGAPDGLFDPVANVEDADDDGVLDPFENDGNANAPNDDADAVLDGDYPVQSGGVWNFSQNFSPHDIDDDGSIELPLGSTTNDYTRAHVVMRTANHEMGHSVGISPHCSDTTCAMYGGINNYNRHGHFCNTCRAKILIHNN